MEVWRDANEDLGVPNGVAKPIFIEANLPGDCPW